MRRYLICAAAHKPHDLTWPTVHLQEQLDTASDFRLLPDSKVEFCYDIYDCMHEDAYRDRIKKLCRLVNKLIGDCSIRHEIIYES